MIEIDAGQVAQYVTTAVTIASIITATTPTPTTGLGAKLYKILEVFALVFGRAKDR